MISAYSPFIQIRNVSEGAKKKVYARGYATIANKPDLYQFLRMPNGKTRKFKSVFTDKCINDMKKQFMNKRIFVDIGHEIATYDGVIRMLKEKGASELEIEDAKQMLEMRVLPIAKPVELEIDDAGLVLAVETNPWYAEYSPEYKKHYEAICGSLLDGYFKGFSTNFNPSEYVSENDSEGNVLMKIDAVDWFGTSLTDNMALADNSFAEVCVRNVMQVRNVNEGNVEKPSAPAQAPAQTKVEMPDVDAIVERKLQERQKQAEIEKQKTEQLEMIAKLQKELDELKKAKEQPSAQQPGPQGRSVVPPTDKFGQMQGQNQPMSKNELNEKLKEMTRQHQVYMEDIRKGVPPSLARGTLMGGFGEAIQLQADMMAHQLRLPGETDNEYQIRMSHLGRSPSDDMIITRTKAY